jgi:Zn-dependent protease with chaperone function/Flp pilus assembly protein TadD
MVKLSVGHLFASGVGAFLAAVLVGLRQKREGGGGWIRLLAVAAVTTALGVLPLVAGHLLNRLATQPGHVTQVALGATAISVLAGLVSMLPPVRFRGRREPLPLITDESFLSRVAELARSLGVSPIPRVRLLGSISSSLTALAWVGGLPAPSLVVSDGILHRVTPDERDAILAHELAHLSTRSLWLFASVMPITGVSAVLVSLWVGAPVAIAFAAALFVGVRRLVSRRVEFACDAGAGRAVGFARTASALNKIHVVHPFLREGLLTFLVHATATHPSRAERLTELRRVAPPAERAVMRDESAAARRDRWAARVAFVLWLASLATGVVLGTLPVKAGKPLVGVVLLTTAFMPFTLILIAAGRQQRIAQRRVRGAGVSRRMFYVGLLLLSVSVIGIVLTIALSSSFARSVTAARFMVLLVLLPMVGVAAGICLLLIGMFRVSRIKRVRADVEIAIRVRDFARAQIIIQSAPRYATQDPIIRHNVALATAIAGDREAAMRALDQLARDMPRLAITFITLAVLCHDGDPSRSLECAEQVARLLPNDPSPHFNIARALRRLGRLLEAEAAAYRAITLAPHEGTVYAVAACIALERNDVDRAQLLAEQAIARAPGDAFVLLSLAELAVRTGTSEHAQAAIAAARAAIQTNPFAFLDSELEALAVRAKPN